MNVILSIKPEFADAIFKGIKKVEFRKILFKKDVEKIFIYTSAPVKKITGYFTIDRIVKSSPRKLWEEFGDVGFIDEAEFFNYFGHKEMGFSICIEKVEKFSQSLDPYQIINGFVPPQSFRYHSGKIV